MRLMRPYVKPLQSISSFRSWPKLFRCCENVNSDVIHFLLEFLDRKRTISQKQKQMVVVDRLRMKSVQFMRRRSSLTMAEVRFSLPTSFYLLSFVSKKNKILQIINKKKYPVTPISRLRVTQVGAPSIIARLVANLIKPLRS